ncbi:MAG: hypothetical protein MPW14_02115 [Candidatus Manganitrophus sp.]|nr:hypothetical protein [Candidatus Manganitrophus sp.]WDT71988.1 MAG: hypothetical protein MPW17_03850 [Candidatus Manganitrophus sp.]WDT80610.1 MAG: hypothetical protein MPW14_02115 [Candidatus Manganitrophus sp.]
MKLFKEQWRSLPERVGSAFYLTEGTMQSSWQVGAFIISSLLMLALFVQSMISIDRDLRNRQARIKEKESSLEQ